MQAQARPARRPRRPPRPPPPPPRHPPLHSHRCRQGRQRLPRARRHDPAVRCHRLHAHAVCRAQGPHERRQHSPAQGHAACLRPDLHGCPAFLETVAWHMSACWEWKRMMVAQVTQSIMHMATPTRLQGVAPRRASRDVQLTSNAASSLPTATSAEISANSSSPWCGCSVFVPSSAAAASLSPSMDVMVASPSSA
eukprot:358859-Chlamydomonas_euryale.AAC.7